MAASEHRPVLIVIAGPNGSGKTSVTSKILHHEWLEDSEYINPDNVARDMFGDWNDRNAVLRAADFCKAWRERCLAERKSHIFETVMSASDNVDYILRAKEAGFSYACSSYRPTLRLSMPSVWPAVCSTEAMTFPSARSYPVTTSPLQTAWRSRLTSTGCTFTTTP